MVFIHLDVNAPSTTKYTQGFIISIGPQTDLVIEYFGLGDSLIPKLRDLAQTIRSSRWEAVLRSPVWGLTHAQAADLSNALLADTQTSPMVSMQKSQVS